MTQASAKEEMRISIFFLVVTVSCSNAFDTLSPIIPSRLEGKTRGHAIHVAELKVGTPRQTLRLALDFSGSKVYTYETFDETDSSTYSPVGGGSDLLWVGGRRIRPPFETDEMLVLEKTMGSNPDGAFIDGLLGVGPSSPLWFVWKEATFSSGAVTLGTMSDIIREANTFGRLEHPHQLENYISCEVGFSGLCKTKALVGPNLDPVTVIFSFEERRTLVPGFIFLSYVGTKNVYKDPLSRWDDFPIVFTNLSARSKSTTVSTRIRKEDLVSATETSGKELNLDITSSNDTVYIGRTAWRSFSMHRYWIHHDANIIDWRVQKEFSSFPSFLLIAFAFLATWWIGSSIGEWDIRWRSRGITIFLIGLITGLALTTVWVPSTRQSIREFLLVDIFFQISLYVFAIASSLCLFLHMAMRRGAGPRTMWMYRIFGFTLAEEIAYRTHWKTVMSHTWSTKDRNMLPDSVRRGGYIGIQYAGHPKYIKKKKYDRLLPYNLSSIRGEQDIDWTSSPPVQMVYHYADLGSQRLWSLVSCCVNGMLFISILYAWFSTREDTLTGIGSVVLMSFFILVMCYHFFSIFYHRAGHHSLPWYAYVLALILFLGLLATIAEVYVFYPFVHRFIPDYSATPSIVTLFFILVMVYFAETVAKSLVSLRGILYHHKTT